MLTDRELILLTLGNYRIATVLEEVARAVKQKGGDVTLLPEAVKELAELTITPTVEIED